MIKPELFDVVELLVDIPEDNLRSGNRGTIVENHEDGQYEVEFTNDEGETLAMRSLSSPQFIIVWQAKTKRWLSISEKLAAILENLSSERQKEVFDFACFLRSR